jgi:hypothetical protein
MIALRIEAFSAEQQRTLSAVHPNGPRALPK